VSLAALYPARRQAGVDLRHFDGGRRNGGLLCVSMKMSASQRGESKTSNSRFDGMWGSHLPRTERAFPTSDSSAWRISRLLPWFQPTRSAAHIFAFIVYDLWRGYLGC
jgi:hypothetical protein